MMRKGPRPWRQEMGEQTGRLPCSHCRATKPVSEFGRRHDGGWRSWCKGCHRQYLRDRYRSEGKKSVQVLISPADLDYMMDEMVPDSMPRNFSQTATRVVADAIAGHKRQQAALKARLATGGIDRGKLMAGR